MKKTIDGKYSKAKIEKEIKQINNNLNDHEIGLLVTSLVKAGHINYRTIEIIVDSGKVI